MKVLNEALMVYLKVLTQHLPSPEATEKITRNLSRDNLSISGEIGSQDHLTTKQEQTITATISVEPVLHPFLSSVPDEDE